MLMRMISAADIRSGLGINVYNFNVQFDLDPWRGSARLFQKEYKFSDKWRLPVLKKLMANKYEMAVCDEETETITVLIESFCST